MSFCFGRRLTSCLLKKNTQVFLGTSFCSRMLRTSPPYLISTKAHFSQDIQKPLVNGTKEKPSYIPTRVSIPTGAFGGVVSALTGVGGGIFMGPILRQFTSITQHASNGTCLFAISISSTIAAISYSTFSIPNIPVALIWGCSSVLTTGLGVNLANRFNNKNLTLLMAVFLFIMAPVTVLKPTPEKEIAVLPETISDSVQTLSISPNACFCGGNKTVCDEKFHLEFPWLEKFELSTKTKHDFLEAYDKPLRYMIPGFISGIACGLFGIGGGSIMTLYLHTVDGMPQINAVGTSLLSMAPIGISATFFNARSGNVHFKSGLLMAVASSMTGLFMSQFVGKGNVDEATLTKIFAGALLISSFTMFRKYKGAL